MNENLTALQTHVGQLKWLYDHLGSTIVYIQQDLEMLTAPGPFNVLDPTSRLGLDTPARRRMLGMPPTGLQLGRELFREPKKTLRKVRRVLKKRRQKVRVPWNSPTGHGMRQIINRRRRLGRRKK